MSGYELPYRLTMCYPNFLALKFVAIPNFIINITVVNFAFLLEFVIFTRKFIPH
jgi:hypothetical protein